MKIKYLSGPRAGESAHVENSVGHFAISAGLAELVDAREEANSLAFVRDQNAKNPPDLSPRFAVVLFGHSGSEAGLYAIEMRQGAKNAERVTKYYGDPDSIHDRKNYDGSAYCSAFGWPVPEEIREKYRQVYKKHPKQTLTGSGNPSLYNRTLSVGGQNRPYVTDDGTEFADPAGAKVALIYGDKSPLGEKVPTGGEPGFWATVFGVKK
jgi:hypothetical protein